MLPPKLFISYSWSTAEHQRKVIDLATELRESGVDVLLDIWDLKEGHDAVVFMEQMVTDPEIKKVAIICDEIYAAKADGRAGGVGTETQIISKEVYEDQSQEKFVVIVWKKDDNGNPILPTYYKSRIYIDLSEADRYAENYEQLLRWIFDKPLNKKPELGTMPSFLAEGPRLSLGTTATFKRCIDAIRNDKAFAEGVLEEYCILFASNLEHFRLNKVVGEFDDAVLKNIEEFLPYRNEAIQLFIVIAQYSPKPEFILKIHRLFESLIPYMLFPPAGIGQHSQWDWDNFKFIIHELFLYALAVLLKHDRFEQANCLFGKNYYIHGNLGYGGEEICSFVVFRHPTPSLHYRNNRLNLGRLSLRADLLKERCNGTGIEFRYLLQADFVAFMRAEIHLEIYKEGWWPEASVHLSHAHSPCEIFARSISKSYFNKIKILLSIDNPKDLEDLLHSYSTGSRTPPHWQYESIRPEVLLGYDALATQP